ncbi:MAG TPA: YcxB family protein [Armatimonadota bacterium]|nr:YcxB family protein [Armatimonadota bacterium]
MGAIMTLPALIERSAPAHRRQTLETLVLKVDVSRDDSLRLWEPNVRRLRIAAIIWISALLVSVVGLLAQTNAGFWNWLFATNQVWLIPILNAAWGGAFWLAIVIPVGCVVSLSSARRSCYLATDEIGIRITSRGDDRVFRWHEITGYEPIAMMNLILLRTRGGEQIRINFSGLSRDAVQELQEIIRTRARL